MNHPLGKAAVKIFELGTEMTLQCMHWWLDMYVWNSCLCISLMWVSYL